MSAWIPEGPSTRRRHSLEAPAQAGGRGGLAPPYLSMQVMGGSAYLAETPLHLGLVRVYLSLFGGGWVGEQNGYEGR